jgi:hypothetical protein
MRSFLLAASVLLATFACGCAEAPAPRAPATPESVEVDIDRATAVRTARRDAASQYGDHWIAWVDATQLGRWWVVELRARNGKGMRYAISTRDGSIRERSLFQ